MDDGPAVIQRATFARAGTSHFFHDAFQGSPVDLERWMGHLREEGAESLGPCGHGRSGGLSIYCDDPNGYRLEIVFDLGDHEAARSRALALGGLRGNPSNLQPWT